ncbi:FRG domain-containing protein [Desulfolutivibrio sp.]|uniref:FRG domain-containing protein n=1 Tax=Desulfolutivibrio sp. TaxID=2773296 RepID=UPI002F960F1B
MTLRRISIRSTHWESDSGIDVLHADEPHALVQAAGYLKFKHADTNSEGIYFRGQRKIYGSLVPSLYRNVGGQNGRDKKTTALNEVVTHFLGTSRIFSGFKEFAHEALLQHYGINTTWIDLVDNIWIALWFACHRAMSAGKRSEYVHFERRIPSSSGKYAYILLIGADIAERNRNKPGFYFGAKTELVDLRMAVPSVFLRPHSQHGLVFRMKGDQATGRPLDYGEQIRCVIRVDLERALYWLGDGKTVSVHSLFPPPYYDSGYGILLSENIAWATEVGSISRIGA